MIRKVSADTHERLQKAREAHQKGEITDAQFNQIVSKLLMQSGMEEE